MKVDRRLRVEQVPITRFKATAAMLGERGRLRLQDSVDRLLDEIASHASVEILPLTPAICLDSVRLPRSFPRDPADRRGPGTPTRACAPCG